MKTFLPKVNDIEHKWYIVDAEDKILGRLSTRIAEVLRGKHKKEFTPFFDMGDYVVVINADKIKVTGNKKEQKIYKSYSGYPGGLKKHPYKRVLKKNPRYIIYHSVKGMLPKNKLGRKFLKRLKLYTGDKHPHQAQKLEELKL